MSTEKRTFWLIALLFFMCGCSGFKQVGAPRTGPEDPCHDIMGSLETGDRVRVTLEDDVTITGKVTGQTANSLTIESKTDPADLQTIPARKILILEKGSRGSATGQAVTVVLAVGLFGVIIAGLVAGQVDSDFGGLGGEG